MDDIHKIVEDHKPEIFGVTESCFRSGQDESLIKLDGFKMFFPKTSNHDSLQYSHSMVYVSKKINAKIRLDLMVNSFSSIQLEMKKSQNKLLGASAGLNPKLAGQRDLVFNK